MIRIGAKLSPSAGKASFRTLYDMEQPNDGNHWPPLDSPNTKGPAKRILKFWLLFVSASCNYMCEYPYDDGLTHWGRVTDICVSKLTIIGSDNGLSPGRLQTIIWTNVGILLIRPLETNFSEILIEINTFSRKSRKCIWKCQIGTNGFNGSNSWLA